MPPNAPSGANHMISRITPKMTRLAMSKALTTRSRRSAVRKEIATAVRMASTSTRRISFSTNGPRRLSGSRLSVMNDTTPWSPPASPIDSFALAAPSAVGLPSKPAPGLTRLPTIRPRASATIVITRK